MRLQNNLQKEQQYKPKDIDWGYFRDLPIEEVAELLGIDVDKKGRFICPSHNDTNPSAHMKPKGRNTWCCYVCGGKSGGTPIDLVMAVEGIDKLGAVMWLEQYFPGGIVYYDNYKKDEITPPYLTPQFLREIGLKRNPFVPHMLKGVLKLDEAGGLRMEQDELALSYRDATDMVINKISAYIVERRGFVSSLFRKFPEFDDNTRRYIQKVANEDIEKSRIVMDSLFDFKDSLDKAYHPEHSITFETALEDL